MSKIRNCFFFLILSIIAACFVLTALKVLLSGSETRLTEGEVYDIPIRTVLIGRSKTRPRPVVS